MRREIPRPVRVVVALLAPLVAFFWLRGRFVEKFENWTGPAEWIWATTRVDKPAPRAFVAVRSFSLPKRARAELRISGDREFVAYLNGRRIGGGRGGSGLPLRRWLVTDLLVPGENRLAVELRSHDGVGGLIACLAVTGVSDSFLVTDGSWVVHDDWREAVHPGGRERAVRGNPAESWGRPPMHPWGYPRPAALETVPRVIGGDPIPLRDAGTVDGKRKFVLDEGREAGGILRIRFDGTAPRAMPYAVRRAGQSSSETDSRGAGSATTSATASLAIVPSGKGFWESAGRELVSSVVVSGDDASAVTAVELVPSDEPMTF